MATKGPQAVPAADLVPELLDKRPAEGCWAAGVAAAEADHLLAVIGARVATGRTVGGVAARRAGRR